MDTPPTDPASLPGQAAYSPLALKLYDLYVLALSNRVIWRCPTPRLLRHYDAQVGADHLDVGVGTGYFLDRCRFPVAEPSITLMDLNANSLEHTAARIARYAPRTHRGDVLAPIALPPASFDSIGLGYLLHCLPHHVEGGKWKALAHLAPLLRPSGVLFGATILGADLPRNGLQRVLMRAYNRQGIFSNTHDTRAQLEEALSRSFAEVRVEIEGVVALFSARAPRNPASPG